MLASWIVAVALRHSGDRHCYTSQCQDRRRSTAVAWCETDAGSAGCLATRPLGSDRSTESGRAVSTPGVSCFPPAARAELPDAMTSARPAAGSKTLPDDV